MFNKIDEDFCRSMDSLHFSPEDKDRMVNRILQYQNQTKKSEGANRPADGCSAPTEMKGRMTMKRWTLPKIAAVVATCIIATGGTVFAASKIVMYTSSSNSNYDYTSIADMNTATSDLQKKMDVTMPEFPDSLGGDYVFDGGNTVNVRGKDEAGNTIGKWDDLRAVYKNADGGVVNLNLSYNLSDDEDRTPTETRTIDGITVAFNYDEYLILPNEDEPLDTSIQERMENDDHFFVSYGGDKETFFFSGASFVKDGVRYLIFTEDNVSADDLFSMAEELITR